jgi:hypothetical protein
MVLIITGLMSPLMELLSTKLVGVRNMVVG